MFKYKKTNANNKAEAWFFKEDFKGHKPCLLSDGRVRTSTHDFESIDAMKEYIADFAQSHSGNEVYYEEPNFVFDDQGNRQPVGVTEKMRMEYHPDADRRAVLRWIGALANLETLCPDSGIANLFPDVVKDTLFVSAPDGKPGEIEMFIPIEYQLDTCCSALQDQEVDKDVLTSARPELSTFTTNYPLSTTQASIINTILSNIEYVNLERLFNVLLPVFVEAVHCGINRRIVDNELISTQDPAEVEEWMNNIIKEAMTTGIDKLPTVKEVLNKKQQLRYWN